MRTRIRKPPKNFLYICRNNIKIFMEENNVYAQLDFVLNNFNSGMTEATNEWSDNAGEPVVSYSPCPQNSAFIDYALSIKETDTAPKKTRLTNANIIKNISFDQTEILWNIMKLYNNGKPFECDITASKLGFYGEGKGKYNIPVPKYLFDVFPQEECITKIEKWGDLPLDDGSIHSIVIDLPFVISPAGSPSAKSTKKGSQLIANRFSAYYPVDNLYLSYYNWILNAYRVLDEGGLCVFKCQSMISGGIRHNVEEFSFMAAQKVGFKMIDKFTLEAKARLISNAKMKNGQEHSRSYTSMFLVFRKESKFKSKEFNYFDFLERCEREKAENFVNVVEK